MNAFRLVLERSRSYSRDQLLALHSTISANPSQIGKFLASESARTDFLARFTLYVDNILQFLELNAKLTTEYGRRSGSQHISREVVDLLASVLSHSEFDLTERDTRVKFILAALKHGLRHQPASLKVVAIKLAEKPALLEYLASSKDGAGIIEELFRVHFVSSLSSISHSWVPKLVGLIAICTGSPSCHGIASEVRKWRAMTDVTNALEQLCQKVPTLRNENIPPSFQPMRRLDSNDKKADRQQTTRGSFKPTLPPLPDNIIKALNELQLQPPQSLRGIEVLLERIRSTEMPELVRTILSTFPCRPCNDLSRDPKALMAKSKERPDEGIEDSFTRAAVAENTFFGSKIGLWDILLSAEAMKDIQRQTLAGSIDVLEARLRRLASGDWKGGKFSRVIQTKSLDSPLLEAEAGKQLRILWQMDIGCCDDGVYRHHIKIWRVVDRNDIPKVAEHIVKVLKNQTPNHEIAFSHPATDASGAYIPSEFHITPADSEKARLSAKETGSVIVSVTDRRALEVYNKFYEFTKPVMDSFLSKSLTAEFPFHTSPEEKAVIKHDQSGTLIMGRSGTGKTTCLVQKLLRNCASSRSVIGQPQLRQILLTRSKFLAEKLKIYTKRLVDSQLSKTISVQGQLNPHEFSLGEESVMDSKTIFTLDVEDFPLVLTFDTLLRVLENTVVHANRQNFRVEKTRHLSQAEKSGQYRRRAQTVDYTLFRSEYWKQFPTNLTKSHEPGLVFSEFMGVIKGSAVTESDLGSLSRDEYLQLSRKKAPTFPSEQRDVVYDLYLLYEKQKKRNGDKDGIDRVVSLLKFLHSDTELRRVIGGYFEELYVDEVQDQRCLDLILLLKLIKNPRGIHFAGDTAQCISKDSTFRFADVKNLFYEQFAPLASATDDKELAVPMMFKLTKNFRSHQGIIALASFVMKLLYTGFPQSVDKMEEERGQYSGSIPTLFVGFGAQILASRLVGLTDVYGNVADFGAEQVILVRDDAVKEKVKSEIGELALVLTILDSKGMEFDDVFLLDFFSSSPCPSALRKLQNILNSSAQQTDTSRNGLLCSELKHLYVAITRPRNQLWIFESSPEIVGPVAKLLVERQDPLIEVVGKDHPELREKLKMLKPATSSDPKKYSEMGYQLLQRGNFKDAHFCFRKAKDERGQTISKAHLSMEEGRGYRANDNTEKFLKLFGQAVQLFRDAEQFGNAAFCLEEMNRLEEAGDIWVGIGRHDKAAPLYMQSQAWRKASSSYDIMESYGDAAAALRQGELFDELLRYLTENRERLDSSQTAAYGKLCAILLTQGRISTRLQELIIDLLGNDSEKEDFFRKCKLTRPLVNMLVEKFEYGKAFRELLLNRNPKEALDLALNHLGDDSSIQTHEVIVLLNYMEYRKLLARLFRLSEFETEARIPNMFTGLPWNVSNAMREWHSLSTSLQTRNLGDVFSELKDGFHKDLLAITIALHWRKLELLEHTQSINDLRPIVHALNRAVGIWSSVRLDDQELPLELAVAVGAFALHGRADILLLDYAPFREDKLFVKWIDVTTRTRTGLLLQMIPLYDELHEFARPLWLAQAKGLCARYIDYGWFPGVLEFDHNTNFATGLCEQHDWHRKLTSDECRSRIQDLKTISSLLCSFQIIYYRKPEEFNAFGAEYLGRRRFWLENLLGEITFRSAIEHDCAAITETFSSLTTGEAEHAVISCGLEELLFYRLKKGSERRLRSDLSSIFEQIQLSEGLGLRVATHFREYVQRDMKFLNQRLSGQNHQLQIYYVITYLQRALGFAKLKDATRFRMNLREGLAALKGLVGNDFSNFHSILTVFERLTTYLYFWVCPAAFVLPLSWIKLHIPALIDDPTTLVAQEGDKIIYGECLIKLLQSFIGLLRYLDKLRGNFRYTFGYVKIQGVTSKDPSFAPGIQERNRNLLVISLINLAAMGVPLRGSTMIYDSAQELFKLSSLKARDFQGRSPAALPEQLTRSFAKYQGKDSLTILTTKDKIPTALPAVLAPFASWGFPIHSLQSLVAAATPLDRNPTASPAEDTNSSSSDTTIEQAVQTLQAFWRKRSRYLHSRRAALNTPGGKATAFIFDKIIRPSSNDRHTPGRIHKAVVLLTDAKQFFVEYWSVCDYAGAAHVLSESVLDNRKISTHALDELVSSPLLKELEEIRAEFERGGNMREMVEEVKVKRLFEDQKVGYQRLEAFFISLREELLGMGKKLDGIVKRLNEMQEGW
ncbi:hypothetical protein K440DRAFT_663457 [Wilcoxina mikolae CBS 423.85]|nr:hypothetical protein K440DRAFT_663457 [Wilcoxina mikolae CBS 423.85]